MGSFRQLLGREKRRCGSPVEGDHIFPLHFIDQSGSVRNTVHVSTWHFDDVLDGDLLHQSLVRLLSLGDWQKLGGRFRQNKDGKLEIRVPKEFTSDRPAVHYSRESLPMRAMDHPLASRIPKARSRPCFHPATEEFLLPLCARPGMPHNMNDYLSSDEPLLSLRVVAFQDATIVAVGWPHAAMDMMGFATLLRCWSLVLAGRESEIPVLDGVRKDLLYQATLKPTAEEYALEPYMLIGFRLFMFAMHFICDLLFGGRRENRILHIPKESIENLRTQVMAEASSDMEEKPLHVSRSDATLSLFSRSLVLTQKRPLLVVVPMDLRPRLKDIFLPDMAYVQNAIQGGHFVVDADEGTAKSLGDLAQSFRQNIIQQGARDQLLAMLRCNRKLSDSGTDPATIYGPSNAVIMVATNVNRANLFSIPNFAPAVVGERSREQSTSAPGTASFFNTSHSKMPWRQGNILLNLGIDHDGGHWIAGTFNERTWKHIEESLKSL